MGSITEIIELDPNSQDWHGLVAAHRQKQYSNIPKAWRLDDAKIKSITGHGGPREGRLRELGTAANSGILSPQELEIAETMTASELLGKMHKGQLTSEEVTVAFCKMAAVAQQTASVVPHEFSCISNSVTDILPHRGLF